MVEVETVNGLVPTSELGFVLVHEHLRVGTEAVEVQFPHVIDRERDIQSVVSHVEQAKAKGLRTLCDPTVFGLGRDVRFSKEVAARAGIHVLVATGIYTFTVVSPYFDSRSAEDMADLFVRDIEEGIQGTSIKAAFLKCATDEPGVTPGVEKVLRATAIAHRRTGAPIMTHSYPLSGTGLKQQDILEDEGVDLRRVLIGHSGDVDDVDYLVKLVERGSFIGMDRYGDERRLSTERRNRTVVEMCRRGYADKIMLSQDHCCVSYRKTSEEYFRLFPKRNLTYVINEIIPILKKVGLPVDQIAANPRRWLEMRGSY